MPLTLPSGSGSARWIARRSSAFQTSGRRHIRLKAFFRFLWDGATDQCPWLSRRARTTECRVGALDGASVRSARDSGGGLRQLDRLCRFCPSPQPSPRDAEEASRGEGEPRASLFSLRRGELRPLPMVFFTPWGEGRGEGQPQTHTILAETGERAWLSGVAPRQPRRKVQ